MLSNEIRMAAQLERTTLMNELQNKILALKKEKNALILAHYYQSLEVQDIADSVGDSFALAKQAQSADADIIIVCGVRFMAESAKILNPDKTVYQSNPDAGCPMANMISAEDVKRLRAQYPEAAVVCYVNSSAAVKAESDICCTSSSAEKVVRSLPNRQILFVPDQNLGSYVAAQLPEKEVILYNGCCPIHHAVSEADALRAKAEHPHAKLLIHPECPPAAVAQADYVGSTAGILAYARKSDADSFIIGTESGICDILRRELPNKEIIPLRAAFTCVNMKKTTLEDVLACLEGEAEPVELPSAELKAAALSLERMVSVG